MQIGVVDRDTHRFFEAENLRLVFSREELPKLEELYDFIGQFLTGCKEYTYKVDPKDDFYTHDHFSLKSDLFRLEDSDVEIVIFDEGEK